MTWKDKLLESVKTPAVRAAEARSEATRLHALKTKLLNDLQQFIFDLAQDTSTNSEGKYYFSGNIIQVSLLENKRSFTSELETDKIVLKFDKQIHEIGWAPSFSRLVYNGPSRKWPITEEFNAEECVGEMLYAWAHKAPVG